MISKYKFMFILFLTWVTAPQVQPLNTPRLNSDWITVLQPYEQSVDLFGASRHSSGSFHVRSKLGVSPHDGIRHSLVSLKTFETLGEAHVEWCRLFRLTTAWGILLEGYDHWFSHGVFRLLDPGYVSDAIARKIYF